jgi:hypothetical protein
MIVTITFLFKKLLKLLIKYFSKKHPKTTNYNLKNPRFIDIFCNPDGQLSSMRLCFVWFTFIISLGWLILSLQSSMLLDLPKSLIYVIIVLAGGKSLQSFWGK